MPNDLLEQNFSNYFKSEIRSSGERLHAQEKVALSCQSDREVQVYIQGTPSVKVRLTSREVSREVCSDTLVADCRCPNAHKNQFCKHVWAALVFVQERLPDFLIDKRFIEKTEQTQVDSPGAVQKARASSYRKEQYQKQKQRVKDLKQKSQKSIGFAPAKIDSPELEAAMVYFEENGFPMKNGPCKETIAEAKRKLSRVFHPDKGGTNEEMVELNRFCELVLLAASR